MWTTGRSSATRSTRSARGSSAHTAAAAATSGRLQAAPTVEALHEWRKRVKDLWYHHTLLRELWPPVMQAVGDEAHELADRLGDDHDLAVLADWVREHAEAEPEFFEAVERRRTELQAEAMALGERLYADKPRAYVRRLRRLWNAAQASVRAP